MQTILEKDLALRAVGTIASLAAKLKGERLSDVLTSEQMETFQALCQVGIGGEMGTEEQAELIESAK